MPEESRRPATERADELLGRAGFVAGMIGSMVGRRVARVAAFAREEAEDLWAEAQSMRSEGVTPTREAPAAGSAGDGTGGQPGFEIRTGDYVGAAANTQDSDDDAAEIKATKAALIHAEELGVDLRGIKGSGTGGQITVADVRKKAGAKP